MPTQPKTRIERIERSINKLHRAYNRRKLEARRVDHLLIRCQKLSAAYLAEREPLR